MLRKIPTSFSDIKRISELQVALEAWSLDPADIIETSLGRGLEFRAHPLGFISCIIFEDGDKKARLHIWPVSENISQGEGVTIHDHIFNFTSWVLTGGITNKCVFIDGGGVPSSVYETSYSRESSILLKNNETLNIMSGETHRYSAGDKYSLRAGQLHETRSLGNSVAVTVLITQDVSINSPLVIGSLSGMEKYEYHRKIISRHELEKIIKNI